MSWALFIDESGQDQKDSPYEVLAGAAIEDRKIWRLIRELSDTQQHLFGMRLFEAYGKEAKAQNLLKKKTFRHANQGQTIAMPKRSRLVQQILKDGTNPTRDQLTALGQAKMAYCQRALELTLAHGGQAFASIVPQSAPRPETDRLRKDYSYLFERFFYFLNSLPDDPMGYLVFDELDKSASHILLGQVREYFVLTAKGRTRSRLIIPEPFFVHSDLTTMIQVTDLVAYIISWGVRLKSMREMSRAELEHLAKLVLRLRFRQETAAGHTDWGFKVISDLRAAARP